MEDECLVKPLMVFHHPGPVAQGGRTGSQVRPWKMLQGFREAGYEIMPVIGRGKERKEQIRQIEKILAKGHKINFLYSEARSIPTLLSEPHRLPTFPLMDFQFIRRMRKSGVPIGLFYRDVFWRFEMYRTQLALWSRAITIPLYHYDWWWYQKVVDHLFLPSLAMRDYLPDKWLPDRLSALPPGVTISGESNNQNLERGEASGRSLKLLYVGGVQPPTYDLTPLFEIINEMSEVELTLCCREDEWQSNLQHYEVVSNPRIKIAHLKGEALDPLYSHADVFAILRKSHVYLDFAAPVKLFEAVGHGVPIITFEGTETARIVRQNNWGWVARSEEDMVNLLQGFMDNPTLIDEKRNALIDSRRDHAWLARAKEVASKMKMYDLR